MGQFVKFGFSKVKTIKMTLNFNKELFFFPTGVIYFEKYLLLWAQPVIILTYWSWMFFYLAYVLHAPFCRCNKNAMYRRHTQKLPNWPLGARTAGSFAFCHLVMLNRCFSGSFEFCSRNPTLCFASQWVFIFALVNWYAPVSNWGAIRWVRFCFRLGKTESEMLEILRKLSLTKPMLVHAHLFDFLVSHLRKLQLKIVIVRTSLHGSYRSKCGGNFQNGHWRPMKYHFGDGWTWGGSPRGMCLGCSPMSRSSKHFWQLATWLWAPTLLTRLIWPIEITSCFQECNISYKGVSKIFLKFRADWDTAVGTVWTVRGFSSGWGNNFRSHSDWPWPTQPFVQHRFTLPGVKRPGRGVEHPSSSSAETKERIELYALSVAFMAWSRITFTFTPKFGHNRWPSYTRVQKVIFKSASSSGKNSGPILLTRKGSTLKVARTSNIGYRM